MSTTAREERHNVEPHLVKRIRDWTFPGSPRFTEENITAALDYRPEDGDIIICSYPKTGTTWTEYIVLQILHKGKFYPDFQDLTFHAAPFMELAGIEAVKRLKEPRFYKNHFTYHMMITNDRAKYIYTYRNPGDTIVSLYYFLLPSYGYLTFDDFFERFLDGNVSYGDYFDHVLSFYQHRHDANVLLVSYEDLLNDTTSQILRIARFLGDNYYRTLLDDELLLREIQQVTSFDYMKQNLEVFGAGKDGTLQKIDFFRKGTVGDWKNHLSLEQEERLRQKVLEKMKNTELIDSWSL